MSLAELARNIGVTSSLISQIETGRTTPSVGTLYAIALELGISLDELFEIPVPRPFGAAVPDPSNDQRWQAPSEGPVLRTINRPVLTFDSGVRWERLTASGHLGTDFIYCYYPPGSESCPADDLMTHGGFEWGLVLDGVLGASVGKDDYELAVGDTIAFDSRTPHRLWAIGSGPATAISVVIGREDDHRLD